MPAPDQEEQNKEPDPLKWIESAFAIPTAYRINILNK